MINTSLYHSVIPEVNLHLHEMCSFMDKQSGLNMRRCMKFQEQWTQTQTNQAMKQLLSVTESIHKNETNLNETITHFDTLLNSDTVASTLLQYRLIHETKLSTNLFFDLFRKTRTFDEASKIRLIDPFRNIKIRFRDNYTCVCTCNSSDFNYNENLYVQWLNTLSCVSDDYFCDCCGVCTIGCSLTDQIASIFTTIWIHNYFSNDINEKKDVSVEEMKDLVINLWETDNKWIDCDILFQNTVFDIIHFDQTVFYHLHKSNYYPSITDYEASVVTLYEKYWNITFNINGKSTKLIRSETSKFYMISDIIFDFIDSGMHTPMSLLHWILNHTEFRDVIVSKFKYITETLLAIIPDALERGFYDRVLYIYYELCNPETYMKSIKTKWCSTLRSEINHLMTQNIKV